MTWSAPDTACEINDYKIVYFSQALWGEGYVTTHTPIYYSGNNQSLLEMTLTSLTPYSNHSFTITASTDTGFSHEGVTIYEETKEDSK